MQSSPSHKPGPFLTLVLTGFLLVSLPLGAGLVSAWRSVDRLEAQSRGALYTAAKATQNSRALVEQILDLERKARQFLILGDAPSREAFANKAATALETVSKLGSLELPATQHAEIRAFRARLERASLSLQQAATGTDLARQIGVDFEELSQRAQVILDASNTWAAREADGLQQTAAKTRRVLLWQTAALIPATVFVGALFAALIFRPVHQIHQAIIRLGEGDLQSRIAVKGPQDLELLGERLDWLRRRLAESLEQKQRFLAHLSHDLKTPLTAVREGAELLADEVVGGLTPQQKEVTEILQQNSIKLHRSIEALLDFGLTQTPARVGGSDSVPLSSLVADLLADHKPAAMKKELTVHSDLADVWARGSAEELRVVVDNLLSNAVKFTPAGGRIRVTVARRAGEALVDVEDSGPGIGEEDRERVFEAFYRGASRADGLIKGSGLGLSIASELAASHGGRLEIVGVGPGAHFRLTLPLEGRPT
ncbi:MAG: HAMP domain-containing histidine kinase [Deltaproteobacteria bacterium]|nr:HAMP domain-containing histidine kinase [Deltaproteobacteria bacterium]